MAKAKPALREAYAALLASDEFRRNLPKLLRLRRMIGEMAGEARNPMWFDSSEAVQIAKKILSRALQRDWTRAEVEAFLKGE